MLSNSNVLEQFTEQFTDDTCDGITLNNELINCVMYADDLVLLSRTESGMHTHAYACIHALINSLIIVTSGG